MRLLNAFKFSLMALITTLLMGCQTIAQLNVKEGGLPAIDGLAQTKTVQEVQKYSDQGTVVHLRGNVGKQVPLLNGVVYELQDSTGKIWVLLRGETVPPTGSEVAIKGRLRYQSISINQQEQGMVYIEQQP